MQGWEIGNIEKQKNNDEKKILRLKHLIMHISRKRENEMS